MEKKSSEYSWAHIGCTGHIQKRCTNRHTSTKSTLQEKNRATWLEMGFYYWQNIRNIALAKYETTCVTIADFQ